MTASYRDEIAWIAENDGSGDQEWLALDHVSKMVTTLLVADLFKKDPEVVAKVVIRYRGRFLQK